VYQVRLSREAIRTLQRLPGSLSGLIRSKIDGVAAEPYAPNNNVKKLAGRPGYRLRVGDWRVIYELDDAVLVLAVERVAPRGGAYR
jgi:mRNA interferase RelE/StbE